MFNYRLYLVGQPASILYKFPCMVKYKWKDISVLKNFQHTSIW
jgi:hypothetical protein